MTDKGLVNIQGVSTNECPISLITPQSTLAINLYERSRTLEGINIFGDASKLPAKFIDALEIIAIEKIRTNNALTEAKATEVLNVEE